MDELSMLIDKKVKTLEEEIATITRKRDVLYKKLTFYNSISKLHEKNTLLWAFLRDIREITTSLNKSIEDEKE